MPKAWCQLDVPLHEAVYKGVLSFGFPTMTPVQEHVIPLLLKKKDVAAQAVTGSGKTLAFLVPVLDYLLKRQVQNPWGKHEIGAVIISPTRELALQTRTVLDQFLNLGMGLKQILFVGGTSVEEDIMNFKSDGGNIVICTPGRMEDLLGRQEEFNLGQSLKNLEILILDEADKLLELGFQKSIDYILSCMPKQRRTGLFSATQTQAVVDLARAGLRNPVLISVNVKGSQSTPELLNNYYIITKNNGKLATLIDFLEKHHVDKAMLFLPTCAIVDYWAKVLPHLMPKRLDITLLAIHGKMKLKRNKVLQAFRNSTKALLLCTDVMARGIDVPEVNWVLQWDPPASASSFVHRVGRTARQGQEGSALILLVKNEEAYVPFIECNQRVKMVEIEDTASDEKIVELRNRIRAMHKKDRALIDKGAKAFVSHIRAYSKHECSLLLKVKELNLGALGATYGLLQLPKMPELKNRDLSDFPVLPKLDINLIPYKDKIRENIRLEKLNAYKETGVWPGHKFKFVRKSSEPWSIAKQKKDDKKERHKQRKRKKELHAADVTKKKKCKVTTSEDLEELKKDIALLKKLKRKKISEEEFDKEMGLN